MLAVITAQAVLDLGAEAIADARGEVAVHRLTASVFGPDVANWAVADNRKRTEASAAIAAWVKSGDPTGVIAGLPGHGKTAACARWAGLRRAHMIRAVSVAQWPWGGGAPMQRALSAEVLFVDDLGRENPTQQGSSLLVDVICGRHDAGRITIATSMIGKASAKGTDKGPGRYPDHMMDRIGDNWIGQRKKTESFRGNGIAPVLDAIERARRIVILAHAVDHVANRVGLDSPDGCAAELASLIGLTDDALAERVEDQELEFAAVQELAAASGWVGEA